MPKPVRTSKDDINVVSVGVTRAHSEREPIDLAAEATASAPAKSLDLVKEGPLKESPAGRSRRK